jgi:protein-tyrosine-phosphatase
MVEFRQLGPESRAAFARGWLRRLFQRGSPLPPGLPVSPRVLFVCHGNILRSAVAEALYQRRVAEGVAPGGSVAESAGTDAQDGSPADPRGIIVGRELGVRLDAHRAALLSDGHMTRADLILVMDYLNEAHVVARYPDAAHKVRLLGSFVNPPGGRLREIRDPYVGTSEDVRGVFAQILEAVDALATTLSLSPPVGPGNPR